MSARILTDGAHLSDGTHMSGDEVRDTVLASVGLWRDETGFLVATQASPGGRHLAFDPSSPGGAAESDGTSGPVHLAAAVARYLATVAHPDDQPLRPGQRWLLMLDDAYPLPVTVSLDGREFMYGNWRIPVVNWPPGTRRYLSEGVAS